MISAVTGVVREVGEDRVLVEVGPFVLEAMVPASDLAGMRGRVGREIVFHTLLYLEGESGGGNSEPRLLGFTSPSDKRFFERFITVKGIGPRKALRALSMPVGEVADAIERKDSRKLSTLPGIGKRLAEQIIAELSGKVQEFAEAPAGVAGPKVMQGNARSAIEEDAILTLMTLGERRADAEALLDRARTGVPATTDALVRAMLRLRGT